MAFQSRFFEIYDRLRNHINLFTEKIEYTPFLKESLTTEEEYQFEFKLELLLEFCKVSKRDGYLNALSDKAKLLIKKYYESPQLIMAFHNEYSKYFELSSTIKCCIEDLTENNNDRALKTNLKGNKLFLRLNKLRNDVADPRFKEIINESREIQSVLQTISTVEQLRLNYSNFQESISNVYEINTKKLNSVLKEYSRFLANHLRPILLSMKDNLNYLGQMDNHHYPGVYDTTSISPYFMFIVFTSLENIDKYYVVDKKMYDRYWLNFLLGLKHFIEFKSIVIKSKDSDNIGLYFSELVTPTQLELIIKYKEENNSPIKSVKLAAADSPGKKKNEPLSDSTLRKWLISNAPFFGKFKSLEISVKVIVANLEKEHVESWFKELGLHDNRFIKQLHQWRLK